MTLHQHSGNEMDKEKVRERKTEKRSDSVLQKKKKKRREALIPQITGMSDGTR